MDEVSISHFGAPFATISAIDLLDDSESKGHLVEARIALESGNHETCVISCRKAIFVEIEKDYDISAFGQNGIGLGLFAAGIKSPYHAKNKDYIERNVHEPSDNAVLDHSRVDQDLLTNGVDPTDFWNVWRLTPSVFKSKDGSWFVKRELAKLDGDTLREKSEYVFATSMDIILAIHSAKRAVKWGDRTDYYVDLVGKDVLVYRKADRSSEVAHKVPDYITRLQTGHMTPGLKDEGPYWHVSHFDDREGLVIWGYVHSDDVGSSGRNTLDAL